MGLLDRWTKKQVAGKLDADKGDVANLKPTAVKVVQKTTKDAAEAVPEKKQKSTLQSTAYRVLVRPLVTEKTARQESANKYTFVIERSATKGEVKRAIKEVYGVLPASVAVSHMQGRQVRFGKFAGRRGDYKKAIITLPKGSTISIHEGV